MRHQIGVAYANPADVAEDARAKRLEAAMLSAQYGTVAGPLPEPVRPVAELADTTHRLLGQAVAELGLVLARIRPAGSPVGLEVCSDGPAKLPLTELLAASADRSHALLSLVAQLGELV